MLQKKEVRFKSLLSNNILVGFCCVVDGGEKLLELNSRSCRSITNGPRDMTSLMKGPNNRLEITMTFLNKTLATVTASFIAVGGAAFADGHQLNVDTAYSNLALDTNGDAEVDMNEIIDGNVAFFDQNADGTLDARERGVAEQRVMTGGIVDMVTADTTAMNMGIEFDADAARLDMSLDTDNDGSVSDEEIIIANAALFDTDNNGALDADERGVIEQALMSSGNVIVDTSDMSGNAPVIEFDVAIARADLSLDTNGDNDVSDRELIDGSLATFDTNGDGLLDAEERGVAEQILMGQ